MSMSQETQTLYTLRRIFHEHLLLMNLHHYNTKEKMMNMLCSEGSANWTTEQILNLAVNNKIKWIKGSSDPTPYDIYVKSMNTRLAEILSLFM